MNEEKIINMIVKDDEITWQSIIKDLVKRGYQGTYYLQRFVFTENTIGKVQDEKTPFDTSKLLNELEVVWRV